MACPSAAPRVGRPQRNGSLVVEAKIREIFMPALSSTMTEGKIVSWVKNEGDKLSKGILGCNVSFSFDSALVTLVFVAENVKLVMGLIDAAEFTRLLMALDWIGWV